MDFCIENGVCRCCLSMGTFRSLGVPYIYEDCEEIYSVLLRDTFNVVITPSSGESYTICEVCVPKLREAAQFKKQVLKCEESFAQYYAVHKDKISVADVKETDIVKAEVEVDVLKLEIEENNDSSHENDDFKCSNDEGEFPESSVKIFIEPAVVPKIQKRCRKKRNTPKECKDEIESQQHDYKCEVCYRQFTYLSSFKAHMRKHEDKTYSCQICNIKHRNDEELTVHIQQSHYSEKKYACTLCVEDFNDAIMLKYHLVKHFKERVQCKVCSKELQKCSLPRHMKMHRSGEKKHVCDVCNRSYVSSENLKVHMQTHEDEEEDLKLIIDTKPQDYKTERLRDEQYICLICNTKQTDLTLHIESNHSSEGNYPCTLCTEILDTANLLKNHLATHIMKKVKCPRCHKTMRKNCLWSHMKTHSTDKKYSCKLCQKSFFKNKHLKAHLVTHTGERPFMCDVCGRTFNIEKNLLRHIRAVHEGDKPFSCNVCNRQFAAKSSLDVHVRQHTGEEPYTCDICKKGYKAYASFVLHKRKHSGEKPFSCSYCSKQFAHKNTFKVHLRIHTGEKPYTCNYCNKQFAQNVSLKLHQCSHTGDRPFRCEICSQQFAMRSTYNLHQFKHTGVKPYSCDVCKNEFTTKGNLKNHMKIHSGVKHVCEICKHSFNDESNFKRHVALNTCMNYDICKVCNKGVKHLAQHMKVHSEDNPFTCRVCNKQFSGSRHLKSHMLKIHSEEKMFYCEICCSQFSHSSGLKRHICMGMDIKQ